MSDLNQTFRTKKPQVKEAESHWLPVSDLMAGLMMVFMFISIALMRDAMIERDKIKEVAVTYQQTQQAIYEALVKEFEAELQLWGAQVDRKTLSFDFNAPEVLFASGQSELTNNFRAILDDFFPRYVAVLNQFESSIDEVRIEGHTSSYWGDLGKNEAYFQNMRLSQSRTRAVLDYTFHINIPVELTDEGWYSKSMIEQYGWLKSNFVAIGFSSAKAKYHDNGLEDAASSRRVSFRVLTNAETQIRTIIEG